MSKLSALQLDLADLQSQLTMRDEVISQLETAFVDLERKTRDRSDFNTAEWISKRFVRAKVRFTTKSSVTARKIAHSLPEVQSAFRATITQFAP